MLKDMADVMRHAYERNWITTRDGNCSLRIKGDNDLYITPSGVKKFSLNEHGMVKIHIFEEKIIFDEFASGELQMHWLLHRNNTEETRSVLHLHPTYCVAAMYAGYNLLDLSLHFPEIHRYTKVANNVPVVPATSEELARKTYSAMCIDNQIKYDIVGQERHGVCAVGKDPWEAFEHIERLEHICKMVLAARGHNV
jgi:L-fuculose-phosphate aldolase